MCRSLKGEETGFSNDVDLVLVMMIFGTLIASKPGCCGEENREDLTRREVAWLLSNFLSCFDSLWGLVFDNLITRREIERANTSPPTARSEEPR